MPILSPQARAQRAGQKNRFVPAGVLGVVAWALGLLLAPPLLSVCSHLSAESPCQPTGGTPSCRLENKYGVHVYEDAPLDVDFPAEGWRFFYGNEGDMGLPRRAFLRLYATDDTARLYRLDGLRDMVCLSGIEIRLPEDALAFARLLTRTNTYYLARPTRHRELRDVIKTRGDCQDTLMDHQWLLDASLDTAEVVADTNGFIVSRVLVAAGSLGYWLPVVRTCERVTAEGGYSVRVDTLGTVSRHCVAVYMYQ